MLFERIVSRQQLQAEEHILESKPYKIQKLSSPQVQVSFGNRAPYQALQLQMKGFPV